MKSHSKHLLRRTLSMLLMCAMVLSLLPAVAFAAGEEAAGQRTYYVSLSGKGGNDGLSESAPLPGLDAVPWDELLPGDSVLLNKGDTFPGMIRLVDVHGTAAEPITIGTYGTGDAPVIEARGQGIWLPKTGNGNGSTPGIYVSSGVTLYDCSYITVEGLTIVNIPDAIKTNFDNLTPNADDPNSNPLNDKMNYFGVGVAATNVGPAEGITLTNLTVRGNSEVQAVKTDTSTAIVTTGVTLGAAATARTFKDASGTYYVSSRSGSDSNDGSSPDKAFYSLHKINELNLQPGAKVYLECGSAFENQYLHIEGGGSAEAPIIIDSYGNTSDPKPVINTNGEGVWYQNYRKNLDNLGHMVHGYVSSCILLYDVPYIEVKNIAMTNYGTYGQTVTDFPYIGEGQVDGGTVPGETGYNSTSSNTVGCYQWGGKMSRTGVGGVAQNKGTITHTLLQNLDIENIYGNVFVKHMDNGGIYFTAAYPLNESATGISRYDDLRIEGCYLKRVSRWGIAAVHTAYWHDLSPNGVKAIPDDDCQTYGSTNVYIGHNYLEEVGGDVITLMHAYEPLTEYNVGYRGGREGSGSTYHSGAAMLKQTFSAGIWPWKCKTAIFEHNECYGMLNSQDGNGDAQAWDADSGDATIYQYNYSSGNTGGCIMYCLGDSYNSVFRYNISFEDGSLGSRKVGPIDVSGAPNGQIYNNLFLLKEGVRSYYRAGYKPIQVWNNIFYNMGSNATFDAEWDGANITYNNNVYCGFGTKPSDDSNAIQMAKSETLFADPAFTNAPRAPKVMDKVGTGNVDGVRNWTHDWKTDFNMFKLASNVSEKIVNKEKDIGYTGLTQDSNFGVPRAVNDTDFFGNELDEVHDIGAQDTRTADPLSSECEVVSSLYELRGNNNTELQVPLGENLSPTVETFLKGLTVSNGATVGVYSGDTKQADDTKITESMTVKVVAEDGTTSKTYTIRSKTDYNSQTDWVDNQQGNVWFYQQERDGVFTNHTTMGTDWKDWKSGTLATMEQNQAVGDINNSIGSGFTFRAPVSGTVTISFNYKAANDNAGKASASGVVEGYIRKRAATPNSKWQTYLRTYRNDVEDTTKAISIPMDSITAIKVESYDITVAQGDTLSFIIRNDPRDGVTTTDGGNHGVYYNPVITYKDVAFTEPDDEKAPTAPTGLRAKNITENGATLSWTASTDNVGVTGYEVTVDSMAVTPNPTGTTHALTGLTADTQYTVTVKAVDAAGNQSTAASVSFRTAKTVVVDNDPPAAPTGGTASPVTADTATISWTASTSNDVDHYEITMGDETVIARNATKATLTGLTPNTSYTVTVKAVDAAGNKSDPTSAITFTTTAASTVELVTPEVGYVVKLTTTSAEIRWRLSDGADGYKVKLGENGAEQDVQDVNRYTFGNLTAGEDYTAYVCAYRGSAKTAELAIPFTTPAVYNSFEDWDNGAQGSIWRYQHQNDAGQIVDHEAWSSQYSCWAMNEPSYKSVERNQACGSVKAGQGSGFTFIAPKTGTIQVRFFYYPDGSTSATEDMVKRRSNAEQGIQPYIRLYVNGQELTKKAIKVNKNATAQSVQPVTVAVQADQKLSILAWNGGDYNSWGAGNCGIYFNPVITYLNDDYVPEATSADISQTTATLYTNPDEEAGRLDKVQLAVTNIQPATANPKITWSIRPGDTGVVSVGETGLVTAKGNGTAVVTATVSSDYGDITKTCTVTVNTRMESITVKKGGTAIADLTEPLTVYANADDPGRSVTLTAEPNPANPTHPNLDWSVVAEEGLITLVEGANGASATIRAAATTGTNVGEATVKVQSHNHDDTHTQFTVRVVRKLANNVSITGTPKFGQTLTVNTSQLQMTQAGLNGLSYQWYRTPENGQKTAISGATNRTYTLQEDDIKATISVTVTAGSNTFYEGEKTATLTDTVTKADGGSVAAARVTNCTAVGAEDGTITNLNSGFEHQYRKVTTPESEWKNVAKGVTEITGLEPGRYQVRRRETDTHTAGRASELTVLSFEEAEDTYAITIGELENGEVTPSAWYSKAGDDHEITLTVEPAEGYQLKEGSLKVYKTDDEGTTVPVTGGKFTMPAYDVTVTAEFEKQKFTLDHQLENIECDQHDTDHKKEYGKPFTINLTISDDAAAQGYIMPDLVTVKTEDGEDFEGYQYIRVDDRNATIDFDQGITQNLTITGEAVLKTYTVTYNIRHLNAHEDDAPRDVEHNAAYTGKLVADEGYALPQNDEHEKVLITMGGVDFTDFTYDPETGVISIAEDKITGNLVITAAGVDKSVDPVPVTGVTLSQTSASLKVDGTVILTATVTPDEATNKLVGWSSSDPDVATVDTDGKVTALTEGTATITVTTLDGGVTATCTVTVTAKTTTPTRPSNTSSTTTKVEPDGTKITTETKPDGTKVETVEEPDGTKSVTETKKDGTTTATVEEPDGTTSVTETKPDGSKTATVEQPDGTVSSTVITPEGTASVTVTDPDGEELVQVELPASITVPETRFDDVSKGHWADEAIHKLAAIDVVNGTGGNKYSPTAAMTRGQLATVLHRFSNGKTDYKTAFKDVDSNKYYAEGVAWAAKANVVKGISEDRYAPDRVITREQLATMLARYAKLIGMSTKADTTRLQNFSDGDNTSGWAVDSVAWCVENGILKGKGNNVLDPNSDVTRAEVAVMLDRFLALIQK